VVGGVGGGGGAGSSTSSPPQAVWYQNVSAAARDPESEEIISWLAAAGGWGTGTMRIDFGFQVLQADASTPRLTFAQGNGYYLPDCDDVAALPVPIDGALEGEAGYRCTTGGDCHLIVVNQSDRLLYEVFAADVTNGIVTGQ